MDIGEIAALVTATAAFITSVGHALYCRRDLVELKKDRDKARAELARLAGDLSAFEKAAEESGVFNVTRMRGR